MHQISDPSLSNTAVPQSTNIIYPTLVKHDQVHPKIWRSQDFDSPIRISEDFHNCGTIRRPQPPLPTPHMGQLIHRYQEQMQKLHECIDQFENPIILNDSNPHHQYSIDQNTIYSNQNGENGDRRGIKPKSNNYEPENEDIDGVYANAPMLFQSSFVTNHKQPSEMTNNGCMKVVRDHYMMKMKTFDNEYDDNCEDDDVAHGGNSVAGDEEDNIYEDPGSDELTDVSNFPNLPRDDSDDEEHSSNGKLSSLFKINSKLSDSPSLDQLAER